MKRNGLQSECASNCSEKSKWYGATLVVASLLLLGSCTTESMYNMAQEVQLQRCEEQPIPVQENCKAQYELSYEDYSRERAALAQEEQ